jgi:hypothetical protein
MYAQFMVLFADNMKAAILVWFSLVGMQAVVKVPQIGLWRLVEIKKGGA